MSKIWMSSGSLPAKTHSISSRRHDLCAMSLGFFCQVSKFFNSFNPSDLTFHCGRRLPKSARPCRNWCRSPTAAPASAIAGGLSSSAGVSRGARERRNSAALYFRKSFIFILLWNDFGSIQSDLFSRNPFISGILNPVQRADSGTGEGVPHFFG